MKCYVDSSVLLRVVLGQPDALTQWPNITHAVSSALFEVECLRTVDRMSHRGLLAAQDAALARASLHQYFDAIDRIEVTAPLLRRASAPFPTPLCTLDAIHLATMLLAWEHDPELVLATHDHELAICGRASGLTVIGA